MTPGTGATFHKQKLAKEAQGLMRRCSLTSLNGTATDRGSFYKLSGVSIVLLLIYTDWVESNITWVRLSPNIHLGEGGKESVGPAPLGLRMKLFGGQKRHLVYLPSDEHPAIRWKDARNHLFPTSVVRVR